MSQITMQYEVPKTVRFDRLSSNWANEMQYNVHFLTGIQGWLNTRLMMRGYIFLNEFFDWIDVPRTRAGQILGWSWEYPIDFVWSVEKDHIMIDLGKLGPIITNLD